MWPLTQDAALDWDPAFSSDGKSVLWSSTRNNDHLEIWIAKFDASRRGPAALTQARQVSNDGKDAENPTMTPDGEWIVYASSNESKAGIWKVRADGRDATPVVAGPLLYIPDVSPDGRYVAYLFTDRVNLQNAIRVAEVESGRVTPFEIRVPYQLEESGADITWGRARWTHDGDEIVFIRQDEWTGRSGVYRQRFSRAGGNTDATRTLIVESLPGALVESLVVSPDGRFVTVSDGYYSRNLMMGERVPGVVGRRRK